MPSDSHKVMCPACEPIRERAPSGVLLLTGEIVVRHRDHVLGLARNEEVRLKAEHPSARIIKIEDRTDAPEGVVITTTDPHLARRIGEALHHAHRDTFACRYEENEDLLGRTGRAKSRHKCWEFFYWIMHGRFRLVSPLAGIHLAGEVHEGGYDAADADTSGAGGIVGGS